MTKFNVGIIGATGMVGQRFIQLLEGHPWFTVTLLAASSRSANRRYEDAVAERWMMATPIPEHVAGQRVVDAVEDASLVQSVDFVFCAVDMPKQATAELEERFARMEVPVVSANSAHRWTPDVPIIIPEVNPHHLDIIPAQRRRLGTQKGFIVCKPNCSLQSFVPTLDALFACSEQLRPEHVIVSTYQAVSGAGKTLGSWPEMCDNVIPFIQGEEEKTMTEPHKIWGSVHSDCISGCSQPHISAHCVRVPVSDGHLSTVSMIYPEQSAPRYEHIRAAWARYTGRHGSRLPSAPNKIIFDLCDEPDRPQTKLDRDNGSGMGISVGRLKMSPMHHWHFSCLSHNTIRGAAGGAILTAELLAAEKWI